MATIQDVAKLAGLSRTTVSRVINRHPYVTDEKKRLVMNAMEELNYVPNSSARRLRKQQTETIAVYVPRITNPFFSQMVEVMGNYASDRGYQLILCQTSYSRNQEINYLELLKTKQVDGLILTSIENEWSSIEPYMNYGPIMLCNEYNDQAQVPTVYLDQIEGGYIGTRHLIEQGHTQIAYCSGDNHASRVASDRYTGYKKALEEAGILTSEDWFLTNAYSIDDGKRVFNDIAKMNDRPTAVFTGSDEVAAGIWKEALNHKWDVPNDLAIIGFDDQPVADLIGLTTIRQPIKNMAQQAMEQMIDIIQHKLPSEKKEIKLDFELIKRRST
ncbi:LacI family DNA-binding transcriptional regulator [Fictibacillus enclensis]|jgi:DNA-binding LacI/PurR family transcriptional regulator|uniref:LacI family DNA-binding transcriptional regulator n=1 Tax=Fictibacillus enclensis TaxID=1017270 RepID=UPI0024BFC618|nr:LacI family DNA-binding transcriptional regulator [Fictibacillus enclensis]WHY73298.1 LacI family DNA-binding transcriptional regulator [Fictibacillus enclensis]